MGKILLLLFTVVPLVELYLLLALGRLMGFGPTVALVLVTGIVGATLAKHEGLRVVRRWQRDLSEGRVPEDGVLGGLLVFAGGLFLVTPGVLTDAFGLAMLFPPTRHLAVGAIRKRVERGVKSGRVRVQSFDGGQVMSWSSGFGGRQDVIDVEGEDVTPPPPALPPAEREE
ncbi:MAG TPA: FxsA family protein [Polyangiaceae bacterium LLY-WYZ-15_(1-7)]|nr:FxsA family protein [Polyangiaceae bacterium LLY-WYZ-15_(1-7)]HJL10441.1 FxsA family protein [Polyangiaceae bacterium LLY-WYZ-15_(1-7)]HJL31859.1 FxsA family protein [Polyangiaceae bacterium LLY-WYZ-15_(1-7)]HJL34880.1 FxsA family protein [Polyangiaceae bacterium LLY-WYZ-15_(1-7)]HJL47907.1 FxsA family protein [Polyangiaceae bacterium LLY-WYZ-15_(1-7)]